MERFSNLFVSYETSQWVQSRLVKISYLYDWICLLRSGLFNSRSYAEDVTSVTSGASQGPHSFNLVFVCVFVCVTPGAIRIWRQKSIGCYKFFNSPFFFQAYPGIRTRTIALHAFPHTLRIHTHSSKLLYVIILRLKALFEYCGQLYVASCVCWYGTGDGVVLPSIVLVPYLSPTVPCHQRRLATMHIQIGLSNARSQCETTWKN